MKALVITLDKCCRLNPGTQEVLEPFRPSVVTVTEFVNSLGLQRLIKAAPLPDEATDEEFLKHWEASGRNPELAADSFMASFKDVEDHEAEAALKLAEESARQEALRKKEADERAAADAAAQKAQEEANAATLKKAADEKAAAAKQAAAAPAKEAK